tara:strand:+ start:100 stop:534 length:435 start_codon:yes stop_codon:yes gene_type:complete
MIWGLKTSSFFDIWSFEHLLSGISIGAFSLYINKKKLIKFSRYNQKNINTSYFDIIFVLFVAYAWETVEHYLEIGLMGKVVMYWFQGVEFWANRLISDPLITVLGYYLSKKYSFLITPSRIISLLWLLIHVFLFPHSMYLHEIF